MYLFWYLPHNPITIFAKELLIVTSVLSTHAKWWSISFPVEGCPVSRPAKEHTSHLHGYIICPFRINKCDYCAKSITSDTLALTNCYCSLYRGKATQKAKILNG